MAQTTHRTVGSIVVTAVAVLLGASLVAGPALAQGATDDGMSGNDTLTDGGTMDGGNESLTEDSMGTDMGTDSMTEDEPMTDDGSMTDDGMGTGTMDDGPMTEGEMGEQGGEEGMDDSTASGGQPGFGVVAGLIAVIAAAFLLYRRRG